MFFNRIALLAIFAIGIMGCITFVYDGVYESQHGAGLLHFAFVAFFTLLSYISAAKLVSSS